MLKQLTALALGLSMSFTALAGTFVVTSNADSGPGTLREAITLANSNGTTADDLILFNLTDQSEEGRTIRLQTELPPLSSRLTIDGSSQTGAVLGISTARVTLFLDHHTSSPFTFLFIQNATEVKIYGLCLKFFGNPDAGGGGHYGIGLRNSSRITVGAPGKGNLFSAVRYAITNSYWNYYNDAVRSVTVQGNVFGLDSRNWPVRRGLVHLINAADIAVGGPTAAEGNVFVGASVSLSQDGAAPSEFFAKVQHNHFNLDWTGTTYYSYEGGNISLTGNAKDDTTTTKTWVLDNVNSGSWPGGIGLSQLTHKVVVQGNKLGTDITGTQCKGSDNDLGIYQCKSVLVGGYLPHEENIIPRMIYSKSRGVHIIKNHLGGISFDAFQMGPGEPFVKITSYDNGLITGKSNAGAKIQLYTNKCMEGCVNRRYLDQVYADAGGNWSFPYTPAMPHIVATATTATADSSTSPFSEPKVDHSKVVVKSSTCGKANGSITGIVVNEGTHIRWLDSYTGRVVSTDTNLVNMPAGSYVLTVSNGLNTCPWNVNFVINNVSPPPTLYMGIQDASCGQANGYLYSNSSSSLRYKWLNAQGDSVGGYSSLYRAAPGVYTLKAYVESDSSCPGTYGPYEVKNQAGPSLATGGVQITAATCGRATGAISGIAAQNVTGTPFVQWVDSLNRPAGARLDLTNVAPGRYRLKFKDGGSCDTIVTSFYVVPNNGTIVIDETGKRVTPAACTGATGAIRGLVVSGGTTFQWTNTTDNSLVGTALDASGLAAGSYRLTVSNNYGCSLSPAVMVVPQAAFTPIGVTGVTSRAALCGERNGFVKVTAFTNDSTLYRFRWMDSASALVVGRGTALLSVGAGIYQLWATDGNGCEKMIYATRLGAYPPPRVEAAAVQLRNDHCGLGEGSVAGIKISGLHGPTVYTWYDESGEEVGREVALQNVPAGRYTLKVVDGGVCEVGAGPYTIANIDEPLAAPSCDNLVIPRFSDAVLQVKASERGSYILSAAPAGPALQQNGTGRFVVPRITADTSFYLQRVLGQCVSAPARVMITVVDKSFFAVPSAFTPNGDGHNDRLAVRVVGYIELSYFRVYNRWGTLVFETSRVGDGWDGRIRGVLQPMDAFVWVAEGKDINGVLLRGRGSFTLIR